MSQVAISVAIPKDLTDNEQLTTFLNALKASINAINHDQLAVSSTKFSLGSAKKIGDALDPTGAWNDSQDLQSYVTKAYMKTNMTTELAKKANIGTGSSVTQFADVDEASYSAPANASGVRPNVVAMRYTPTTGSAANLKTFTVNQETLDNIPGYDLARALSGALTVGHASAGNRLATVSDLFAQGRQVFTASGVFTTPPGVSTLIVTIQAGGGGGESGAYTASNDAGSGGGGGGCIYKLPIPTAAGRTHQVSVGAGGVGGLAPNTNPGSPGVQSSFDANYPNGRYAKLYIASGGGGGTGTGGAGGVCSLAMNSIDPSVAEGRNIRVSVSGTFSATAVRPFCLTGGKGRYGTHTMAGDARGGDGGDSVIGTGGVGTSGVPVDGNGYGYGGAGGGYNATGLPTENSGASGAKGIVIVEW